MALFIIGNLGDGSFDTQPLPVGAVRSHTATIDWGGTSLCMPALAAAMTWSPILIWPTIPAWPTDDDALTQLCTSRYAYLGNDNRVLADDDIVCDLLPGCQS